MGRSLLVTGNPHRENTRASFRLASRAGAGWVELDILPSADGDLMLHHDHFVRIGDKHLPVWSVPTRQLLAVGVERLDGLCEDLPSGLGLYLELKVTPGDIDESFGRPSLQPLLEWAQAHMAHRPLVIASFDPYMAAAVQRHGLPGAWIGNERSGLLTTITAAANAGMTLVVVHDDALGAPAHELALGMEIAQARGISVWMWDADLARIPFYRDMGVTGFCVDNVAGAVGALAA